MPFNRLLPKRKADTEFYDYLIPFSCRFNDNDSAFTTWTPSGDADSSRIMTIAFGIKRCNLSSLMYIFSAGVAGDQDWIGFDANDKFIVGFDNNADGQLVTSQVFRDPTDHMFFCIGIDTDQATAADRVDIEVNGIEITDFSTETYPALNYDFAGFLQNGIAQYISRLSSGATNYLDGYLSELHVIDETKYSASDFGEFKSGIWISKAFTGAYGANGFYLDFSNSSDFGEDQSGNGNDFTDSGLATNDQVLDTPTNNYCTLNVISRGGTNMVHSNGNLEATMIIAAWNSSPGTQSFSTGKWYGEAIVKDITFSLLGVGRTIKDIVGVATYFGDDTDSWGLLTNSSTNWSKYYNAAQTSFGGTPAVDDVMQIAVDADAGKVWFGVNNVWFGSGDPAAGTNEAFSGLSGDLTIGVSTHGATIALQMNYGQLGFAYTPPLGFQALCSANMDEPTIIDSSEGFYANTRTGTGAEATINDVNFPVDEGALSWIKSRSAGSSHRLIDTVRGATLEWYSDSNAAEGTDAQGIKSFLSSGYVLGTSGGVNASAGNFIDAIFREGSAYGLDIVTFTGTGSAHAENHNLGVPPELMILKNRTDVSGGIVYHALANPVPEDYYGNISTTAAFADLNTMWDDTQPTDTQFTVGTHNAVNGSSDNIVAYLYASIPGYSKVFSYKGNANIDGPYIDCSFRSRWILFKNASAAISWVLFDVARSEFNVMDDYLLADTGSAEVTGSANLKMDITSNGIKIRGISALFNGNGNTIVGIAFAEQPGKYSNAR